MKEIKINRKENVMDDMWQNLESQNTETEMVWICEENE